MKIDHLDLAATSRFVKFLIALVSVIYFTGHVLTQTTPTRARANHSTRCRQNQRCSYRISKLVENEYNIVRGIMENLMNAHWNVTLDFVNLYMDVNLKVCDQYMDNVAVDKVLARDFRHPNALFRTLDDDNRTNQSVREQYEAEWFEKYKIIKPKLHSKLNVQKCNALGLKLHALLYQYPERANGSAGSLLRCSSERNDDTLASTLIDFYISQTFMKSCLGNLELLAISIRRLLKFDCERAHKFKIAYFTSKYLNMFRTCDPYLTVSDLMTNESMCSNKELNGTINRKYCSWFEIVCKYPAKCFIPLTAPTNSTTINDTKSDLPETTSDQTNSSIQKFY